jgi:hypothetical protein
MSVACSLPGTSGTAEQCDPRRHEMRMHPDVARRRRPRAPTHQTWFPERNQRSWFGERKHETRLLGSQPGLVDAAGAAHDRIGQPGRYPWSTDRSTMMARLGRPRVC